MRKLKYINLLFLFVTILMSCNKNDNPLSKNAKEGGLIEVNTKTVVYFLNTMADPYDIELKYYQGQGSKIAKIDVLKQFFTVDDEGNPLKSEKTLFKSIDLSTETQPGYYTYTASFNELVSGVTINGEAIPTDDTLLTSGFYWELTYNIVLEDGRTVNVPDKSLFINSRYAGVYNVVAAEYFRLGVLTYDLADWPSTVKVTALNATTFKMEDQCEPFGGNEVYFTIDENSGKVTVLKSFNGATLTLNGIAIDNCDANPGTFPTVPCEGSNVVVKVPSTKDTIKISYGYFTPTGATGPREFYQVMVKQ
jgi:hypothetical protein